MFPKIHIYPKPVKVILFGNSLCRCNQVKMRPYWIYMVSNPVTGVLIKGKFEHKQTQREDSHVKMEADWSGASASQGMPRIAETSEN